MEKEVELAEPAERVVPLAAVAYLQCNYNQSSRNRSLNFARASGNCTHKHTIHHSCEKSN